MLSEFITRLAKDPVAAQISFLRIEATKRPRSQRLRICWKQELGRSVRSIENFWRIEGDILGIPSEGTILPLKLSLVP